VPKKKPRIKWRRRLNLSQRLKKRPLLKSKRRAKLPKRPLKLLPRRRKRKSLRKNLRVTLLRLLQQKRGWSQLIQTA
jgi:hypothetical protein